MRIAIQALISDVDGQEPRTEDIGVLEYDAEAAPAERVNDFAARGFMNLVCGALVFRGWRSPVAGG